MEKTIDLAVVGGGAAGFMGAIKASEHRSLSVIIYESTTKPLEKVRISGGGRCNVTNACWDPGDLVPNYPRGETVLKGAFSRFATGDSVAWFEERGLDLIIEEDGRIFPKSHSSGDVVKCLKHAAKKAGVLSLTKKTVVRIDWVDKTNFLLKFKDDSFVIAKKVLLATGSNPKGIKLASDLGHKIVPPAPSLFSFNLESFKLKDCAGIAVDDVKLTLRVDREIFHEYGRVLITHKGLSGPSILRLSAFAARKLFDIKYNASLEINWVNQTNDSIKELFQYCKKNYPSKLVVKSNPFKGIPKRLWIVFCQSIGITLDTRWSCFSNSDQKSLSNFLCKNTCFIKGRGPFGEEFVTAGGVHLDNVDFRSMESRICKGLYFAGEVLDVDGVTGGFNFQHCWTSGWLAGRAIAKQLSKDLV